MSEPYFGYARIDRKKFAFVAHSLYGLVNDVCKNLDVYLVGLQLWQNFLTQKDNNVDLLTSPVVALDLVLKNFDYESYTLRNFSQKFKVPHNKLTEVRREMILVCDGYLRPTTVWDVIDTSKTLARNIALLLVTSSSKYFSLEPKVFADVCIELVKAIETSLVPTELIPHYNDLLESRDFFFSMGEVSPALQHRFIDLFRLLEPLEIPDGIGMIPEDKNKTFERVGDSSLLLSRSKGKLGAGSSGIVNLVLHQGEDVAQKIQTIEADSIVELASLRKCKHVNILDLIGFQVSLEKVFLYLPLGESLDNIIYGKNSERGIGWYSCYIDGILPEQVLSHEERKACQLDLLAALSYLESQDIMHRDIKLSNLILVGGILKLADFGFALAFASHIKKKDTKVYTLSNRPPEILYANDDEYTFAADVWATGTVILEIETSVMPFYYWLENPEIIQWQTIKFTRTNQKKNPTYSPNYDIRHAKSSILWAAAKILGSPIQEPPYEKFPYDYPISDLKAVKNDTLRMIIMSMLEWQPADRISAKQALSLYQNPK